MADARGLAPRDPFAARDEWAPGTVLLRGFALARETELAGAVAMVAAAAPFRHMATPGGFTMSVAMTNCGRYGWVSSERGYCYAERDPNTDMAWPAMPAVVLELAQAAADAAGFASFAPDACLVNRYEPGARLTLHQDKNERSLAEPIVSVSLGVAATFLFGGMRRAERPSRFVLEHGDVVVWGGPSRLRYHGVAPLKRAWHPFAGQTRFNLTVRCAG